MEATTCEYWRCSRPATTSTTSSIATDRYPTATVTARHCSEHAWLAENFDRYYQLDDEAREFVARPAPRFTVTCPDGFARAGTFGTEQEARDWAEYGHCCLPADRHQVRHVEPGTEFIGDAVTQAMMSDTDEEEEGSDGPDVWALLESPPVGTANVASLYSWSLNYDAGKGPFPLFLDLIGWSQDHLGDALYSLSDASLGFRELHELRDALSDYLVDPYAVGAFVDALMSAESRS